MKPTVNLGLLEGVPLVLEVELGHRAITLGELIKLQVGSVIGLPRAAGLALDIYAGGTRVGRAEVISASRVKTVQITEVADGK